MKFEIAPKSTETQLNWYDAVLYCQFLDINGFGWRLPNKDELNEIYLIENDFKKRLYWSSTKENNNFAWYQNFFGDGYQFTNYKHNNYYVRAIRTIK